MNKWYWVVLVFLGLASFQAIIGFMRQDEEAPLPPIDFDKDEKPKRPKSHNVERTRLSGEVSSPKLVDSIRNGHKVHQPFGPEFASTAADVVEPPPNDDTEHRIAGLNCDRYGGPSEKHTAEMVYWQDIPSDSRYVSPLKRPGERKYLTFEPDEGGWNNIRMSMETAVTLAHAMGRTLVMPPSQGMYLIWDQQNGQKSKFSFADFFHFDSVAAEHVGLEIITFQEFLEREVVGKKLKDKEGNIVTPPGNSTRFEGITRMKGKELDQWMRTFTTNPIWTVKRCVLGIPEKPGKHSTDELEKISKAVLNIPYENRREKFLDNPVRVDADPFKRLSEMLAHRTDVCLYDEEFQNAKFFHLMGDNASGARLLVHFYAYLFFEDWKSDLWTKRFVRDHLRYVDEIQCAAARVVKAMHEKAREHGDPEGKFDTMHVRRGDFQYEKTRIRIREIYNNMYDVIPKGTTIYIATDEKDKKFFEPFRQVYNIYFLDDFMDELRGLNTNFYGMLDQRVASRGRTFVGCYFSTFTGYINRMRGYHAQQEKAEGWKLGHINSYYYVPIQHKFAVKHYMPITGPLWAREFPIGWRDLDKGIEELYQEYVGEK